VAAKRSAEAGPMLKVTWVKSTIGHKAGARGTIRALGLHRLNQTVEIADTPVNRGMLRRVAFLLDVQEPTTEGGTP
jgi:large subunit ribosomal protein L30